MKRALIGYSGFVGSNLLQFYKFDFFYNSKNFKEAIDKEFDEIFFCGVPAVKWYANKNPEEDSKIIEELKTILKTIKTNKFILISTIDVYDNVISEDNEDYLCNYNNNHTYGKNRYLFEKFIENTFENHHIIRLPALFGKGLKKNIIYDLLNNNEIQNIPINSSFQWYDLNWLKDDIDLIINNNIRIFNLFTEPLETLNIIKLFDYSLDKFNNNKRMDYNLKTKHENLFINGHNGYIRDNNQVETSIKKFINFHRINKERLVVSNICIKTLSNMQFACVLKLFGIKYAQIAPTTLISSWCDLEKLDLSIFKDNNVTVYSYQSITFTLNELNIFNDKKDELLCHLKKVIDSAFLNNIKVLVFGCPRNRKIINTENIIENENIFIKFFNELGEYCLNKEITICIENNSKQYNCNFLNTIDEVGIIVRKINHPNIKMMIDNGNAFMENDDLSNFEKYNDIIYNIDVSQENMNNFSNPNIMNNLYSELIKKNNYKNKINLEMIINNENELNILTESLNNFIQIYGDN